MALIESSESGISERDRTSQSWEILSRVLSSSESIEEKSLAVIFDLNQFKILY